MSTTYRSALLEGSGLSRRQAAYLRLALKIADGNTEPHRHGAVLVKGGRVLATGSNRAKNHPSLFLDENCVGVPSLVRRHCSIHAEEDVIRQAGTAARGATLYVARAGAHGQPMLSAPCEFCRDLCAQAGVRAVIFTAMEGESALAA